MSSICFAVYNTVHVSPKNENPYPRRINPVKCALYLSHRLIFNKDLIFRDMQLSAERYAVCVHISIFSNITSCKRITVRVHAIDGKCPKTRKIRPCLQFPQNQKNGHTFCTKIICPHFYSIVLSILYE